MASAYIFAGPSCAGKKEAADFFAEQLGVNRQDKFLLQPQGTSIKIEQIREAQSWVRYGPAVSSHLVVVVEQADCLTDQAAAAFLKTLEEPAPGVVFILLVEREDKIPQTIFSRCQKIIFSGQAKKWERAEAMIPFYENLKNLGPKKPGLALLMSKSLEKQRTQIEGLLYELAFFARYELLNSCYARIILDTLRFIKRRANLKLALDVMCLKLSYADSTYESR